MIHVLTGESGVGKTTLCARTAAFLRAAGLDVAGVVSPARIEHGLKTGIFAQDIRSGERRLLAERRTSDGQSWSLDPAALQWGSELLRAAVPCDVLVVDELGPLELKQGQGWVEAVGLLYRPVRSALVVVRSSLVGCVTERFGDLAVDMIPVSSAGPSAETVSKLILVDREGVR